MGLFGWLFGSNDNDGAYSADQARADGVAGAAADNARDRNWGAGWFDDRGGPDAVEDRYRATGIDRDYRNNERDYHQGYSGGSSGGGSKYGQVDSWGNPLDENGNYAG